MNPIISFAITCIVVLLYALFTIKKGSSSVEEKEVARRQAHPKFTVIPSSPEDEREKVVDRLLKRKNLSLAEQKYIYDFLVDTGKEKWRYIKGYEGFYRINTYGMVESCRYNKRYLDPVKNPNGSYHVCFSVGREIKGHCIHKLVAETFIPNPSVAVSVRPKDGNYSNCDVRNLEWITRAAA